MPTPQPTFTWVEITTILRDQHEIYVEQLERELLTWAEYSAAERALQHLRMRLAELNTRQVARI